MAAVCLLLLARYGGDDTTASAAAPLAPISLAAAPGNAQVIVTRFASGATGYDVKNSITSGGPYSQISAFPSLSTPRRRLLGIGLT